MAERKRDIVEIRQRWQINDAFYWLKHVKDCGKRGHRHVIRCSNRKNKALLRSTDRYFSDRVSLFVAETILSNLRHVE